MEVDDPDVKVTLEGSDLTITGAGPQEVRLKPGTYSVTTEKDGKPVGQEIVTISRGNKTIVRVRTEPAPVAGPPAVRSGRTPEARLLADRLFKKFKDHGPEQMLMRSAFDEAQSKTVVVRKAGDPPVPQTHASFPKLQAVLVESSKLQDGSPRLTEALNEAYALAVRILADTPAAKTAPPVDQIDAIAKQYQETIAGWRRRRSAP